MQDPGQAEDVTVTTVEDEASPFIVNLPLGTPYFEFVQEPTIYPDAQPADCSLPEEQIRDSEELVTQENNLD